MNNSLNTGTRPVSIITTRSSPTKRKRDVEFPEPMDVDKPGMTYAHINQPYLPSIQTQSTAETAPIDNSEPCGEICRELDQLLHTMIVDLFKTRSIKNQNDFKKQIETHLAQAIDNKRGSDLYKDGRRLLN